MNPVKCNGCNLMVVVYETIWDYHLCPECEQRMIEDSHQRYEDEQETYRVRCEYLGE